MKNIRVQDEKSSNPDKIRVWLVTPQGEILLKNFLNKKYINFVDITLEAPTLDEVIHLIENEWGIMTAVKDFNYAFTEIKNSDKSTANYFISIDLDDDEKELIAERCNGQFFDINSIKKFISLPIKKKYSREHFSLLLSKFFGKLHY